MHTLGLELSARSAIAVAVDDRGAVTARASVDATTDPSGAALQAAETLARVAGAAPLGVAAPSPDPAVHAPVLDQLRRQHAGLFSPHGATPSGAAAAVAEAWVGAARGVSAVVFFAVADHAVGGVVRDGEPMLGAGRRAASVAWLALNPVEREDYRKVGCLEAEVAAAGIVRRLIWRVKAGDRSRVAAAVDGDLSLVTADGVLDAARDGDGVAISVVRDTAKYLGMAAANMVIMSDPEMLVLGGIMATAQDLLFEPVRTEIARRLPRTFMDGLVITPAALGSEAAAIGAARLAAAAFR
jgi:predicted NBD/HSP70 family sugar kinase